MIIVESFGRGGAPRGPPSPEATMPHHRLIAPSACRRTPLPLHRCRPAASNRMPCVVDQAEIALSTAAVAPNSPPRSSIRRRLPRPAHPQPRPPHRQIPIVRQPVTRTPRVPSWEAFGRRPSARADRSPRAGIRNPSGKPPSIFGSRIVGVGGRGSSGDPTFCNRASAVLRASPPPYSGSRWGFARRL